VFTLSTLDRQDLFSNMAKKVALNITGQLCQLVVALDDLSSTNTPMTAAIFHAAVGVLVQAGIPRSEMVAIMSPTALQELLANAQTLGAMVPFDGHKLPSFSGTPIFETGEVRNDGADYHNFIGSKRRALSLGLWGTPWIDVQYDQAGGRAFFVEVGQHATAQTLQSGAGRDLLSDGD